ncbi:MAG TPA: hypothetical protein VKP66_11475 [Steroidobacteraceae bacterium]|nr:hypothetical protein [Steroidobacteraceae bacterium]
MTRTFYRFGGFAGLLFLAAGPALSKQPCPDLNVTAPVAVASQTAGVVKSAVRTGNYVHRGDVLVVVTDVAQNCRAVLAPVSGRLHTTTRKGDTVARGTLVGAVEPIDKVDFYRQALRI